MPYADVTFSTEATVIITLLLGALSGAVGLLYRELLTSKNQQLAEMTACRDSYRLMAHEATSRIEAAARVKQETGGVQTLQPLPAALPVPNPGQPVPQRSVADLETLRPRIVAASLALGLAPPECPPPSPPAPDKEKPADAKS